MRLRPETGQGHGANGRERGRPGQHPQREHLAAGQGFTATRVSFRRLRAVEVIFAKVDQRLATSERAIIPAAPPAE